MTTLNIRLETDNAAFGEGDPTERATEIDSVLARMFRGRGIAYGETSGTLRDSNGNSCGEWSLDDDDGAPCCRAVVTSGDPNMHEPGCSG
jgi:hypothetical protein